QAHSRSDLLARRHVMLQPRRFGGGAVRLGFGFSLLRTLASSLRVRFGALAGGAFGVNLRPRGVRLSLGPLLFRISVGLHLFRRGSLEVRFGELFLRMSTLGDYASVLRSLRRLPRVLHNQA